MHNFTIQERITGFVNYKSKVMANYYALMVR